MENIEVAIKDCSSSYLTEEKYNMGNFSDDDLMSSPSFDNGTTNYMVMDFEFSANTNNNGDHEINILVRVPEADIINATIEEAPTGKIEQVIVDNVTSIYASYNIPPSANETRRVQMIVKLMPLNEGVANVDIFLVGKENTNTIGNNYITVKMVSGAPSLRYTLSRDKKYYIASSLWQSSLTEITIPDTYMNLPVKSISSGLFEGNTKLEKLVIGNNVTSLPSGLFLDCKNLKTVTLPVGTTSIPSSFFEGCSSLTTINNMDAVETINFFAFGKCSSLRSINCPQLTYIGTSAFLECSSLEEVVAGSISDLGESAFIDCSSLKFVSPLNITTIPKEAFSGCTSLVWFDLDEIIVIEENAFANCKAFTEIVIPDSLLSVEKGAFAGTSNVKSLYISKDAYAYMVNEGDIFDITSIESIEVEEGNTRYTSENNCLIHQYESKTDGSIIRYLSLGCKNSVIPENILYIGQAAFKNCSGLKSITLPEGLKEIERYAFENCTGLTQITIPSSVYMIWEYAFQGCSSLTRVTMGRGTWIAAVGPAPNYVNETIRISSPRTAAEYLTSTYSDKYIIHVSSY